MTIAIITTICTLLLIAYIFDLTSSKTKVPSVILLLVLGGVVRQASMALQIKVPNLSGLLPVLGTIGLVLIVLEGALELEFNKSKAPLIKKSLVLGFFPMMLMAFSLSLLFQYFGNSENYTFKELLTNAIPFCVISSAIAIPSVKGLSSNNKDFIIYESSLSDILGVMLFNLVTVNDIFGLQSLAHFGLQLLIIIVISFLSTIGLSLLLSKIDHRIKFGPIIILVMLIYALSMIYHLPALIFILSFGLFLGNLDELKQWKWIQKLRPAELDREVHRFRELTAEAAFLIRSLFFLLFGFLIEVQEIINPATLLWAVVITGLILLTRAIFLMVARLPVFPLIFIAPRGLITILLFLAIAPYHRIPLVSRSLIIQVIIITALVMIIGVISGKKGGDGTAKKQGSIADSSKT